MSCPQTVAARYIAANVLFLTENSLVLFFVERRRTDLCEKEPFLNTEEGAPFHSVFRLVRLQYIINDLASARILERDNILPPGKNQSFI